MSKHTSLSVVTVLAVLLLVAWAVWLRPPFLGGSVSYLVVTGSSMEPSIHGGDLAVLRHQSTYDIGEVIAFRADGGQVIHRIVGGTADEGYVVQGDNKEQIDPWNPKPQHIVGSMWVRIPMLGLVLNPLRQPAVLGGVVGLISVLSLVGTGARRARRWRRRDRNGARSGHSARFLRPTVSKILLATFALLAVASGSLAGYAYTQPLHSERVVEDGRLEHAGSFEYEVRLQPSSLYDRTVLSSADFTTSSPDTAATGLYANLVRGLDLRFSYGLGSTWSEPVGEYSVDLVITAEQGWTKTLPLITDTPFTGAAVEFAIPLDLQQVLGLIERIEEETAFKPPAYDLSVIPRVRVSDQAGTNPVEEYSPSFPIRLNGNQIVLGSELRSSESRGIGETVRDDATVQLLGLELATATLRQLGLVGFIAALLPAAVLAVLFARHRRREDEEARLARRDRIGIISVAAADFPPDGVRISVASLQDLARFAEREDRSIFHAELRPGWHRYFVVTEAVTCEYEVI